LQTVFKLSFDTATTGNPTTSIDRVHAHQQQESTDRLQIYRHHVLQPVQAVLFGRPRRKASPIRFASAKDNQIGADKKAQRAKAKNVKRIKTAVMVSRHWRQKIHNQNGIGSLTHPMLIHSIIVQGPLFRDQLDRFKRLMFRDHCSGTIVEKLTTIP
jgi:hypothetical protein